MKRGSFIRNEYAVSEIVGGVLLVLIAITAFSVIYTQLSPPDPEERINVAIEGKVNESGFIILEHIGGNSLDSYTITAYYSNGTLIGSSEIHEIWSFGETVSPQLIIKETEDIRLIAESDKLKISVASSTKDGRSHIVFEGVLNGRGIIELEVFSDDPLLISSLKTNTVDEDLICYNYNIETNFDPTSYVYSWFVDSKPLTKILLPFDKNDADTIRDFSSNDNHATNHGSSWNNDGVVGGSVQFSGNDYISLPYVFSSDGYADGFTIEFWIKTTQNNAVLVSYLENNMFSIKIIDGIIQWDTYVEGSLYETKGKTAINDGNWHHIALNYESSNGVSEIFIDGLLDESKNSHNPGDRLGEGIIKTGSIAKSNASLYLEAWDVLTYDDFESGWGSYTEGGWYCSLYTDGTYAYQGSNAACIEKKWGASSSFYHTNGINVESYNSIKIDFWLYSRNINERGKLLINYYDGSQWINIVEYNVGEDFQNNQFQQMTLLINKTDYNFPTNMKLQFECRTSSWWDSGKLYIDQIYVNASTGGDQLSNYSDLLDEFAIYNKTISGEQIYQNYLCRKEGNSNQSVIVSDETTIGEEWSCNITPVCETQIGEFFESNKIVIKEYEGS